MDSGQLTDCGWFDEEDGLVMIAFDRLTFSMQVEEFLDFFYDSSCQINVYKVNIFL